ncbi:DegV family protein [Bacillus sp. 165]|uniref:DegV family protein n=1 Tax=Bacillus sp. 165 TaxID=1529117 RepID=UPI001AD98595|nr:DegV family protein [Bacillus sp. 165]
MKIAYIIDSMTTLDCEYRKKHHIYIMPLEVILDGTSYEENVDITPKEFYENIAAYQDLKTSQPAIGKVIDKFEQLQREGYEKIVVFSLSSKGSGAYATYCMVKDMVDIEVEVIDTLGASYVTSTLLQRYIENGEDEEQRTNHLARSKFLVVPQDLKQLHKSGRVSGLSFILGNLLKIQPILEMKNGEVLLQEKVRKQKQVEQYVLQELGKGTIENNHLHIMHTCEEQKGAMWKQLILEKFPHLVITFSEVPVSIGVHNGRGTMIFSWFYE